MHIKVNEENEELVCDGCEFCDPTNARIPSGEAWELVFMLRELVLDIDLITLQESKLVTALLSDPFKSVEYREARQMLLETIEDVRREACHVYALARLKAYEEEKPSGPETVIH